MYFNLKIKKMRYKHIMVQPSTKNFENIVAGSRFSPANPIFWESDAQIEIEHALSQYHA